ncbi:exodeoxyribonuclease V subunit gamma [Algicola sagamiensis]|uniref:exodeoxyribonuclease V subunit gamma n=1 Tax=Algicola sagamiensis TaxID=163869 RepID=UPI00037CAF8C|nr:exodeoxyribonuclease V subunit gamma [Algicola sagamiensis]
MFYMHASNQMEVLASILTDYLAQPDPDNLFGSETILVQSPGMSQWLNIQLANKLGVVLDLAFPLPSSFIWRIYQEVFEGLPEQSAFHKMDMSWKLLEILPTMIEDEPFTPLKRYLAFDDPMKLFQLCEKIADVFDQYLMYRPDWIERWESGEDDLPGIDMAKNIWQPILWRALVEKTKSLGQPAYHRANLQQKLFTLLENPTTSQIEQLESALPKRIFIFGIAAMPPAQLQLFNALANYIDVIVFQLNPCAHYWGDVVDEKTLAAIQIRWLSSRQKHLPMDADSYFQVGNPLLSSLGKLGRDYIELLLETDVQMSDHFVEQTGDNLLRAIQFDILQLEHRGSLMPLSADELASDLGKRVIANDDLSIEFHETHSALREVEVLQDQILSWMNADPTLSPKDIIVMMPNVSQYSPFIEAVFGCVAKDKHFIPYAISDHGITEESPILNSVLQLLALPESRFASSELLDLLAVPAIMRRFSLTTEHVAFIEQWTIDSGIRWGIDGQHKSSLGLPVDPLQTWRFGLQRLLLGYALNDDSFPYEGVVAYPVVEGQLAIALGHLMAFFDALLHYKRQFQSEELLSEKVHQTQQLLLDFFEPDDNEEEALQVFRDALIALEYHEECKNYTKPISHQIWSYLCRQALADKGVGQRFLAGQINFCTLMPMRSIPFQYVCLLGMNDADYPRYVAPVSFDLVALGQPRKGDRSRRLDDRYLFLESILSAREKLYISYIGRSQHDNSVKNPSILVSELKEYIEGSFLSEHGKKKSLSQLTLTHPLQPFNPIYYQEHVTQVPRNPARSFNKLWFEALDEGFAENKALPAIQIIPDEMKDLELDALIRFFRHPIRYFYQHVLQVTFDGMMESRLDQELFQIDGLGEYQLIHDQLDQILDKGHIQHDLDYWQKRGQLPFGEWGAAAYQRIQQDVVILKQQIQRYTANKPIYSKEVKVPLDAQQRLLGWRRTYGESTQVGFRAGQVRATDQVTVWLEHLGLCASGHACESIFLGRTNGISFQPIPQNDAIQRLQELSQIYQAGQKAPLPFLPKSGLAYFKNKDDEKKSRQAIQKAFHGDSFMPFAGEGEDEYVQCQIPSSDDLPALFYQVSESIYGPMQAYLEELSYETA